MAVDSDCREEEKTLFAQDDECCIRAMLQEVTFRLSIRNCRDLMTAAMARQRRIFFFLLFHVTLDLVEGTRGILLSSSNRPTGCSRPCTQNPNKTNQCSCCRIIWRSYRRFYSIGRCATATIMDRRGGYADIHYAAASHLEPGHTSLYCGCGTIHRVRYHIPATLQACIE
jgi:hypothetical protein